MRDPMCDRALCVGPFECQSVNNYPDAVEMDRGCSLRLSTLKYVLTRHPQCVHLQYSVTSADVVSGRIGSGATHNQVCRFMLTQWHVAEVTVVQLSE